MSASDILTQMRRLRAEVTGKRHYNHLHRTDPLRDTRKQIAANEIAIKTAVKCHNTLREGLPFFYRWFTHPL